MIDFYKIFSDVHHMFSKSYDKLFHNNKLVRYVLFFIIFCIILFIFIYIILISCFRYIMYSYYIQYKPIETYNKTLNKKYDDIYDIVKLNNEDNNKYTILNDFDNLNIETINESYNRTHIRKDLLSHPLQSIIKLADINEDMNILDMGCGTGEVAIYLCRHFKNIKITGIVHTQTLYDKCIYNIKSNDLTNRINIILLNFNDTNFKNKIYEKKNNKKNKKNKKNEKNKIKKYDRILFLETIGYAYDREKILSDSFSLLKKNGKLFIKSPSFHNDCNMKHDKLAFNIINMYKYNFSTPSSLIHDIYKLNYKKAYYIHIPEILSTLSFMNIDDIISYILCYISNGINIFKQEILGIFLYNLFLSNYYLITK